MRDAHSELIGSGRSEAVVENAPLMAIVLPLTIFADSVPLSVRRYRRLSR